VAQRVTGLLVGYLGLSPQERERFDLLGYDAVLDERRDGEEPATDVLPLARMVFGFLDS